TSPSSCYHQTQLQYCSPWIQESLPLSSITIAVTKADLGQRDIYKVHILQAMIWCRCALASIEPTKIKDCFFHTKLFGTNNETPLADKQIQEARDEIDHNMCLIPPDQRIE
ncbi:hypothetical protein BG015_005738, partial [Linnemannia schmuckeri]